MFGFGIFHKKRVGFGNCPKREISNSNESSQSELLLSLAKMIKSALVACNFYASTSCTAYAMFRSAGELTAPLLACA